jgi:hypothetical protein
MLFQVHAHLAPFRCLKTSRTVRDYDLYHDKDAVQVRHFPVGRDHCVRSVPPSVAIP